MRKGAEAFEGGPPDARTEPVATTQTIVVRDLTLSSSIGVSTEERARPQRIRVNLEVDIEPKIPIADKITEVVNYGPLVGRVRTICAESTARLLETLAAQVAETCFLEERVRGQSSATGQLADLIATLRAGLSQPGRPLMSLLFVGPTGVGKTELAKALASYLFSSERRLVRLDMSEFQDEGSLGRILGDTQDNAPGDSLIDQLRKQPFSLVLLDEFEKANYRIWDLFLQVFDDGRLTDRLGRTGDFRHALILMTSNLGSQMIQEMSGEERYDEMKAAIMDAVGTHFRPEFINRVDDVVVFHPLSREHIRQIVDIQLGYLHDRLADRDMRIHLSDAARDKLAEAGFDPVYGARPLKRAIQQQVENPLAQEILQGKFKPGDVIEVGVAEDRLNFQNAA